MNANMITEAQARVLSNSELLAEFEQVAEDQREFDCTNALSVLRTELKRRLKVKVK